VGKPVAGKTGTTNDEKDAWFIGYTPEITVGAYIGFDKPRHLGRGATGGHLAAPIIKDFLKAALADKPPVQFRPPAGLKLVRIDPRTGMRAVGGEGRSILEGYKPGTSPPDSYFGPPDGDGRSYPVPPEVDRTMMRTGTGGLY
jgi:penicillin-binding protein 1A